MQSINTQSSQVPNNQNTLQAKGSEPFTTVSLILTAEVPPGHEIYKTRTGAQEGYNTQINRTASERFNLTNTIKNNSETAKQTYLMKNARPLTAKSRQLKQDQLLARKEHSVIPTTLATVPEKTLFQKRSVTQGRRAEGDLSIVG